MRNQDAEMMRQIKQKDENDRAHRSYILQRKVETEASFEQELDHTLLTRKAKDERSLSGYRDTLEKKRETARGINVKLENAA